MSLPHLLKFTFYSVGSGGQFSQVFDLRPLSYLEHYRGYNIVIHPVQEIAIHLSSLCTTRSRASGRICSSSIYMYVAHDKIYLVFQ